MDGLERKSAVNFNQKIPVEAGKEYLKELFGITEETLTQMFPYLEMLRDEDTIAFHEIPGKRENNKIPSRPFYFIGYKGKEIEFYYIVAFPIQKDQIYTILKERKNLSEWEKRKLQVEFNQTGESYKDRREAIRRRMDSLFGIA